MVQGVAFRYHTRETAKRLTLCGYVRNLPDGTVDVFAEGEEKDLALLAEWLEQGPAYARVEKIDLEQREPSNDFRTFSIRF